MLFNVQFTRKQVSLYCPDKPLQGQPRLITKMNKRFKCLLVYMSNHHKRFLVINSLRYLEVVFGFSLGIKKIV